MADRIVVMNHGVINQVGTPLEVYREPATAFAANFVGKANILDAVVEAPGRVRIGRHGLSCPQATGASGRAVRAYLRPEDILPAGDASGTEAIDARVDKVDFHGSFCLATVSSEALGQPLSLFLSLNHIAERGLQPGSPIRVSILGDRIRVFDA